jgi:hypothetical protein
MSPEHRTSNVGFAALSLSINRQNTLFDVGRSMLNVQTFLHAIAPAPWSGQRGTGACFAATGRLLAFLHSIFSIVFTREELNTPCYQSGIDVVGFGQRSNAFDERNGQFAAHVLPEVIEGRLDIHFMQGRME